MSYPTYQEVDQAGRVQLARWTRFLPSPGMSEVDNPNPGVFQDAMEREKKVLDHIIERFHDLGGMTPEISKQIGWE